MQNATENTTKKDLASLIATQARETMIDLALWCVLLGAMPRPDGHPDTWLATQGASTQIIAHARTRAPKAPEIRRLLRTREALIADLIVALRPTFRSAIKRTRRERAHAEGIGEEDSLQDGTIGLLRALELWDPYRGLQFNTFANYWIVMQARRSAQRNAHLKCSAVTSESAEKRKEGRRALAHPRYSLESLLASDEDRGDMTLRNKVNGILSASSDVETRIDEADFRHRLTCALSKLSPQMQDIAVSHIYRDETYREIGARLGVTRQAVGLAWLKIETTLKKALKSELAGSRSPAKSRA
jgi:RNA polymerase sigma factor (sigma-70 family)